MKFISLAATPPIMVNYYTTNLRMSNGTAYGSILISAIMAIAAVVNGRTFLKIFPATQVIHSLTFILKVATTLSCEFILIRLILFMLAAQIFIVSTDGFTSPNNTREIGGYDPGSSLPFYRLYPNHHPDQHNITFLTSNHNVMVETNDGGIFSTLNDLADSVMWQSLDNGYITAQFYTVATDHGSVPNDIIIGGLQDNGSWFTNSIAQSKPWAMPGAGDGSYCFVADGHATYYMSRNQGTVAKLALDTTGEVSSYRRIDPIDGVAKAGYLFVNPFVVDPNNNNAMFMSAGNHVWRNDSLDAIALNNQWDSISQGWFQFPDSVPSGLVVTALAMSKSPAGILYYGTSGRKIYRVNNPYSSTPDTMDITGKFPNAFPSSGYMSCIAVDPTDANKVMIVFSNYGVNNLFYTINGGTTWVRVIGNLLPAPTNG